MGFVTKLVDEELEELQTSDQIKITGLVDKFFCPYHSVAFGSATHEECDGSACQPPIGPEITRQENSH